MSYLDKNPFNRPTPSFNSNSNTFSTSTFTTYSNYNYLATQNYHTSYNKPASAYDRADYNKNYLYNNRQSQHAHFSTSNPYNNNEFKYSRTVEDSPFISSSNPFSASTASYSNNHTSLNQYPYQKDSYQSKRDYSYSPSVSNVSGFTDPYQQPYFKTDKYQERFKKSNFQQDFTLQLGKSRENQVDAKYKSSSKEIQISKLLQNNPFTKPSLQSKKYIQNSFPSSQYENLSYKSIPSQNQYQNHSRQINVQKYQQWENYDNHDGFLDNKDEKTFKQSNVSNKNEDKYSHLIYKPTTNLSTSDVKRIQGFNGFTQNENYSQPYEMNFHVNQNYYQRSSENGSRNTFINKIEDFMADQKAENDELSDKAIQKRNDLKSSSNPFSNNNPFTKNLLISQSSQKSSNSNSNGINLNISQKDSIKFQDFNDIESKYNNLNKSLSRSQQNNLFSSYGKKDNQNLWNSQNSNKNYQQKVEQQFQKWGRQSSKKSISIFQSYKSQKDKNQVNSKKSMKSFDNQSGKMNINSNNYTQIDKQAIYEDKKQSVFLKRSSQNREYLGGKKERQIQENDFLGKKKEQSTNKSRQLPVNTNDQLKQSTKQQERSQDVFRFKREVFYDEDQDDDDQRQSFVQKYRHQNDDFGLQRISEVDYSQQRESILNFSNKQSQASSNKNNIHAKPYQQQYLGRFQQNKPQKQSLKQKENTENKTNVRLKNIQQKDDFSLQNFQDIKNPYHEDQDQMFSQESSFQVVPIQQSHQKRVNQTSKRTNLKERVISSLKNDSLPEQTIAKQLSLQQKIPHSAFLQSRQKNIPQNQNKPEEKYEFQSLDQFQGNYKINMRQSGFDFQQDQFEETQRNLGLYDDQAENQQKFGQNKILVPFYGFLDKETENQQKNSIKVQMFDSKKQSNIKQVPLRNYISSISSNNTEVVKKDERQNQEDDHLPSFNIRTGDNFQKLLEQKKQNQKIRAVQVKYPGKVNNYTQQTVINQNQNKSNIKRSSQFNQPKVQKVKIYESQSQPQFQMQKNQPQFYQSEASSKGRNLKPKQNIKLEHKIYESQHSEMQESQTQQFYKSPFQKVPTNNLSSVNYPSRQPFIQSVKKKDVFQSQRLKDTLKYKHEYERQKQRDQSPKFNSPKQQQQKKHSIEAPVRDSFDFQVQKGRKIENQRQILKVNKLSNRYPTMLQHNGNIYHLIPFVE